MNTSAYILLFIAILSLRGATGIAQTTNNEDTAVGNTDYLEKILQQKHSGKTKPSGYYTAATFKSTRIINGHSIENIGKGVLDFRISHRFGQINEGVKNLYGLDNATTKLGFDYGITEWLMVGIGRSSYEKEFDGFVKAKVMRQSMDNRNPVSVSYLGGLSARTLDVIQIPGYTYYLSNRLYYVNQLLIARKFNKLVSLQLMPTYLHYNLVAAEGEPNDVFAIGIGGRIKLSKRVAVTGEYYYTVPGYKLGGYNNSVSLGVDIETGGHVFQLFLTNSAAITERTFIGMTKGDILKGDLHLGFNISRVFTIVRAKEFKEQQGKTGIIH